MTAKWQKTCQIFIEDPLQNFKI